MVSLEAAPHVEPYHRNAGQRVLPGDLQVYNDSQIIHHSPYKDVRDYIETVIRSFARHAPKEHHLVFKHHPMDRGHRYYGVLINTLCEKYGITTDRVIYIHDLSLPALLTHTRG